MLLGILVILNGLIHIFFAETYWLLRWGVHLAVSSGFIIYGLDLIRGEPKKGEDK